jgi:phosphate transport system permease protein
MSQSTEQKLQAALSGPDFEKRMRRRNLRDFLSKVSISTGGLAIIGAVLLIMFFLFYVVLPLFVPASIDKHQSMKLPGGTQEQTLYYGVDEYQSSGVRFTASGKMFGFDLENNRPTSEENLPLNGSKISSFSVLNELDKSFIVGLESGEILIAKYGYEVTYPNDVKTITPKIEYPFGEEPIELTNSEIRFISARESDSELRIVWLEKDSTEIKLALFSKVESMLSDNVVLEEDSTGSFTAGIDTHWLMLDSMGRNLYNIDRQGTLEYIDTSDVEAPLLIEKLNLVDNGEPTFVRFLLGDYSLMVGTESGAVLQWFPVRQSDNNFKLEFIRSLDFLDGPVRTLAIEKARKGFAVADEEGNFHLMHPTAERHVGEFELNAGPINHLVMAPRADGALVETESGELIHLMIENEHPDVSVSSLWGKVWYEGYEEPSYTWQSSSASSDFEPKFSMMPLTWGTIKAALYSMLFAVPIAILAAIYAAFFMDKQTRQWVKPSVEMIEALPTVILGFLAGLWLAPYMEANLPGFFAIFIVVPIGIILFGYSWTKLPKKIRQKVAVGRRAVLMIPVVIFLGWFALQLSTPLELTFFNGDMRTWLTNEAGIDFDQRNAMVIGFAMGFALIPTIFSVAEDAIYNVPSYLVNGSLALGASGWQTLVGVVLPTASPGIFSAIMLGFGRGVGETMIVLMASGNTPLMESNLFEGMRTLSANLAVEMPEAEVASSHYRVLFLSGLVLFIFTFFFNTIAEVVRQRMRRKYGSL